MSGLSYKRGLIGEQIAKDYFEFRGFRVVAMREFDRRGRRMGEIDCIAVKGKHVHFIEVKTRAASSRALESGLSMIDPLKRLRIVIAIRRYLQRHPEYADFQLHLDVCVIELQLDNAAKSVTIISDAVEDVFG